MMSLPVINEFSSRILSSEFRIERSIVRVGIVPNPREHYEVCWFEVKLDDRLGRMKTRFRLHDGGPEQNMGQFLRISVAGNDATRKLQQSLGLAADLFRGESEITIKRATLGNGLTWDIELDLDSNRFCEEDRAGVLKIDFDSIGEGAFKLDFDESTEIPNDFLSGGLSDKVQLEVRSSQIAVVAELINFSAKALYRLFEFIPFEGLEF